MGKIASSPEEQRRTKERQRAGCRFGNRLLRANSDDDRAPGEVKAGVAETIHGVAEEDAARIDHGLCLSLSSRNAVPESMVTMTAIFLMENIERELSSTGTGGTSGTGISGGVAVEDKAIDGVGVFAGILAGAGMFEERSFLTCWFKAI